MTPLVWTDAKPTAPGWIRSWPFPDGQFAGPIPMPVEPRATT